MQSIIIIVVIIILTYEFDAKLTWIFSFEITNEADVFLHPLKGSHLHGIIDHLYWVLQHLRSSITQKENMLVIT